jgi:hypothetical protein
MKAFVASCTPEFSPRLGGPRKHLPYAFDALKGPQRLSILGLSSFHECAEVNTIATFADESDASLIRALSQSA